MNINENIQFIRQKDYKFLGEIGQGGTGRTILIRDESIDEEFVCKKYSTFYKEDQKSYYSYFLDEIKILHTLYHRNVVRVFNYYLYPEQFTGYILMEYVKGQTVDEYLLTNPDRLEDVFLQLIEGFRYLEDNNILHRDIRPENVLISDTGVLKIIDFGFGKNVAFDESNKSISLNWRYAVPEEFEYNIYDFKTEIYFVGKLFEEILQSTGNASFKFSKVVSRMVLRNHNDRISSFFDVYRETIDTGSLVNEFSLLERVSYQQFAKRLTDVFAKIASDAKYNQNIDIIIRNLEELYTHSLLEDEIQNSNKLARIFVSGNYTYYTNKKIGVSYLSNFIKLLKESAGDKRKIIMNNLWERLDSVRRYEETTVDDLPF